MYEATHSFEIIVISIENMFNVFVSLAEVQYREVKALEYCNMLFSLPDDYPAVSPSISIECSWMSSERVSILYTIVQVAGAKWIIFSYCNCSVLW